MTYQRRHPIVIITGASGNIGSTLCSALNRNNYVIGLDIKRCENANESINVDLTADESIQAAFRKIRETHGNRIAAVIHLAAYFDFTGQDNPLYQAITVAGTQRLLAALQEFDVERFIYASTMLVHEAGVPGSKIDENTPIKPGWAYPKSKAEAESVIIGKHGKIPYTILRLAGVYDNQSAVPTLSHQIVRIFERDFKAYLYSGDLMAGQAFIHKEDMVDLFVRTVARRLNLPDKNIILAGENEVMSYQELQNRIGNLVFGEREWSTISLPEFVAKPGAWLEEQSEPIIPDAIDQGEKPFIRPFMIDLASDHYNIDIARAKALLDWQPRHRIYDGLEKLVSSLKQDPVAWYKRNGITPPEWLTTADEKDRNPDVLRETHESKVKAEHYQNIWSHFLNIGLGGWQLSAPFILGYQSDALRLSSMISGVLLCFFASLSLSWRLSFARWFCALVGFWLLNAPLVFWASTAGGYLNDTLVGMLVIGFSVLTSPAPGISAVAAATGPTVPSGWSYSPSGWFQRLPIILLAFFGFFISRYLCAYQLGHIDGVWEPFFTGSLQDPKNGTEEIITSSLSEAWPVPDAGLGAMTYALEILTGMMGAANRWRTMPWLVILFGVMIVPLGAVSIFFIIVQPILIGTWCTLCLIAAAAMLVQIPYSIDELVATCQFLVRRKRQGKSLLRIFFVGDSDDESSEKFTGDNFEQPFSAIFTEMWGGGVNLPWNLVLSCIVGVWLMFGRVALGSEAEIANVNHLIGSLTVTIVITALAETGRVVRLFLLPLGFTLLASPFFYEMNQATLYSNIISGLLVTLSCWRRGAIEHRYGSWEKYIV